MTDLKPCPFCTAALVWSDTYGEYHHPVAKCILSGHKFKKGMIGQWNRRALPAVQPVTEPDYCYDEAWEYTMPWGDRDTLVEWADLTKPVPIYTLIKGPTKWAVNIPLDTDGDGEADDFELTWFDTEDAALAALKGETP